jgi:hypothetical protein
MRPRNGVDAVDLHKADPLDQVVQGLPRSRSGRRLGQGVSVKKQAAGTGVRDQDGHPQALALRSVSANGGFVTRSPATVVANGASVPTIPLSPDTNP